MADFAAVIASRVKLLAAAWTRVRLVQVFRGRALRQDAAETAPCPPKVSARPLLDRERANRASPVVISLFVLFEKPIGLRRGNYANEVNQHRQNNSKAGAHRDVLEDLAREMFVYNDARFPERRDE